MNAMTSMSHFKNRNCCNVTTRGQSNLTKAAPSPQSQSQGFFSEIVFAMVIHIGAYTTRDRRISTRGQIVAQKFCAAVKIVAKQSTAGCHDAESIARCLRRNTPPSPGIGIYSNTTSRSVARSFCRNTSPSPPSHVPSTETPRRHRHRAVTL